MKPGAGFTLVEMLVVMGLLGGLVILSLSLMKQAMSVDQILEDVVAERDHGTHIATLIRRDLGNLILPRGQTSALQVREDDTGRLFANFVTSGRLAADEKGVVAPYNEGGYILLPHPDHSSASLLYRRHDWFIDEDYTLGGTWELISDRVATFELRFGNEQTALTRAWPDGQFPTTVSFLLRVLPAEVLLNELPLDSGGWETREFRGTILLR